VLPQVDPDRFQAAEILLDHVGRRGFQDHLQLRVFKKSIGIVAVPAVGGSAARLDVGDAVGRRAQDP
jgi:hypothetical protein